MDNYPKSATPEMDEGGGIITTFDDWWPTAKEFFPNVPKYVAKYWLHEHWEQSPFGWLSSRKYEYEKILWPPETIGNIRSGLSNFERHGPECLPHGRYLLTLAEYKTSTFMKEHRKPPASIIVVDNSDNHLSEDYDEGKRRDIPKGYILVEGHRRYSLCLALQERGELEPLSIWLLKKKTAI